MRDLHFDPARIRHTSQQLANQAALIQPAALTACPDSDFGAELAAAVARTNAHALALSEFTERVVANSLRVLEHAELRDAHLARTFENTETTHA